MEKAFGLLEFLAASGQPASLQSVTEAVKLPKPTAYRLLQSLQKLGYVSRPADSRHYLIGPRANRLASNDPNSAIKSAARPLLRLLHEEHNETVNLGVLSGKNVHYLDFLETTQALRYIVTPGDSSPYYCTALGRAIAAQLESDARDRLFRETRFQPLTPRTVRNSTDLAARVHEATRRGYAEECEESVIGVVCLAANLAVLGFPNAAISIAIPTQRLTSRRKAALVRSLKKLTSTNPNS